MHNIFQGNSTYILQNRFVHKFTCINFTPVRILVFNFFLKIVVGLIGNFDK